MHILANQPERLLRRMCNVAIDLPQRQRPTLRKRRPKAERRRINISRLLFKLSPVNRPSIQPWRRSRLQSALAQTKPLQTLTQQNTGRLPTAPCRVLLLPTMDQAIQKGSSSNNRRASKDNPPIPQFNPAYDLRCPTLSGLDCAKVGVRAISRFMVRRILQNQIHNLSLLDKQIPLPLKHLPHSHPIQCLIALRPRRPHRRPTRSIQQPKLNPAGIRDLAHHATQRIHLPHQMPLGDSTNRRITTHLRNQIQIQRKDSRPQTHARRGHRRLAPGMPCTHHNHIVLFRKAHSSILNRHPKPCLGTYPSRSIRHRQSLNRQPYYRFLPKVDLSRRCKISHQFPPNLPRGA